MRKLLILILSLAVLSVSCEKTPTNPALPFESKTVSTSSENQATTMAKKEHIGYCVTMLPGGGTYPVVVTVLGCQGKCRWPNLYAGWGGPVGCLNDVVVTLNEGGTGTIYSGSIAVGTKKKGHTVVAVRFTVYNDDGRWESDFQSITPFEVTIDPPTSFTLQVNSDFELFANKEKGEPGPRRQSFGWISIAEIDYIVCENQ
jgi:hypothetical protein